MSKLLLSKRELLSYVIGLAASEVMVIDARVRAELEACPGYYAAALQELQSENLPFDGDTWDLFLIFEAAAQLGLVSELYS